MLLVWLLWFPWVPSEADCKFNQSPLKVSSVLDSLQCYNDYKFYFHCTWNESLERHVNGRLQLWFQRGTVSGPCRDRPSDVEGTRVCRYETGIFSPGTYYTAYFKEHPDLCPSVQPSRQDVSLLLRSLSPNDLTPHTSKDRGTLITWSSPYPQSPALNNDITYQVNYRRRGHDDWTDEQLSDTQKKLDPDKLIPGQDYEAKVRARVSLGPWSHWSPTVSWHTPPDPERPPRVDCVLWGEREARCTWEQSTDLGHFIVCRRNHTATSQDCCKDPAMGPGPTEDTVTFSCVLPLTQASTSPLSVELLPTRTSKTFKAMEHIRPYPPKQVKVTEKGTNWEVKWTPPEIKDSSLTYEVRYYSQPDEKDAETFPVKATSYNIPGASLIPARKYFVKVRSLVVAPYKGTPSDWSYPVDWTPPEVTWPYWIYALGLLVFAVFITFVIVLLCKKRILVWSESIPSPYKSKVILDIQVMKNLSVMVSEETYLCKVMDMDTVSTCSAVVSLWPKKALDDQAEEAEDEGVWSCDHLPESPLDRSSMSFSGPYILCPSVDSKPSEEDISEHSGASCSHEGCPSPAWTSQSEEGYVRLPSSTASTSEQRLTSQNHCSSEEEDDSSTEESTQELRLIQGYISEALWPQGGALQGSGYCQLPPGFTQTQPP